MLTTVKIDDNRSMIPNGWNSVPVSLRICSIREIRDGENFDLPEEKGSVRPNLELLSKAYEHLIVHRVIG